MARFPSSTFFHLYSAKRRACNKVTHSSLNRSFHSVKQWDRSVSSKSSHLCLYNSQFRRCLSYLVNLQTANLSPQSPTNKEFTRVVSKSLSTLASDDSESGDEANWTDTKHVASRDPVELYRELRDYDKGSKKTGREWEVLVEIFKSLAQSGWASNQALAIYIGLSFYPTAVQKFRGFFMKNCSAEITEYLVSIGPSQEAERFLFPIFVEYCLENFPEEIRRFRGMLQCADLTKPHTWYPFARAMKRKIVYHCGPTNSGKTFNALERFMEAEKGVYCSPLRLLAAEVFSKVSPRIICNLVTGQEQEDVAFANHVVCTVEMVSIDDLYDVAVIDEIQMMADSCRGFAWTRALLGLKADEIHLCGDSSVLNIVRNICSDTGDELVEHHYERLKPLEVQQKSLLGDLSNVQRGDCVVAFSRREIFEVKLAIEKLTSHRCCVIYGSLPPETRREQANLFNEKGNGYDVLVASDAIGMGMNLDIGRVVFYTLSKYNGDKIVPVPATQVKQIAGRAGRMGKDYPKGLTTTLHLEDLDYLNQCVNQPVDEVKRVGLFPFFEQVELFAGQLPNLSLCELLDKFSENCLLDGSYFLSRHDHIKKVARMLEEVPGLSLQDRFNFCFAPVNIRDPKAMHYLLNFAKSYSQSIPARITMGVPKGSARSDSELLDLETKHQILSMYLWLSLHFKDESFPLGERKRAEGMATDIAKLLGQSLEKVTWEPESRSMNSKPPQEQDLIKTLTQKQDLPQTSKPAQKQDVYQRPLSLVKLFKLKKRENVSHPKFSEKVADISP